MRRDVCQREIGRRRFRGTEKEDERDKEDEGGAPTTFRGPHTDRSSRIYGESERALALAKPKTELSPSLVNPGLENTGNVAVVTPLPTALLSSSSRGRKAPAKFENRSTPGTTERNHLRSRERSLRLATPRISPLFKAQIARVNSLYYRRAGSERPPEHHSARVHPGNWTRAFKHAARAVSQ